MEEMGMLSVEMGWNEVRSRGLEGGKGYDISSGTGFYVAPGYILTNQHVVEDCLNISIRGAVPPAAATLLASNHEDDLALLKSDIYSPEIANFMFTGSLALGDRVYVIGYPLERGDTGQYLFKEGVIDAMDSKEIECNNIIEKGNSGSPLINGAGNVIGIIYAKTTHYHGKNNEPYKITGSAVGLASIDKFLSSNYVNYSKAASNEAISVASLESRAKDYVVNVHCVKMS